MLVKSSDSEARCKIESLTPVGKVWKEYSLGELLTFRNGKTSPTRQEALPHPVFGANGIIGFADRTNAPEDSTIIGRVGSYCGSLHYSERPCWVTDNAIWATARGDNDPKFLFFLLNTLHLHDRRHGSGQPLLNQTVLSSIRTHVPRPTEQHAIARILSTLDEKIELNRRINKTLEAMAKTIFKDWFVDFGPVCAKIEGRKPYLPSQLWNLFPNRLNGRGIPSGWVGGSLSEIATAPRRSIRPIEVATNTPYVGLEHMPRCSISIDEWSKASTVSSNKYEFKEGEVLFGKLRPYFHKVVIAPIDGICSTDIVVVVPRLAEWNAFLLACLSSKEFVDYTDQTSTGTKMPRTSWKTMSQYEIVLPSGKCIRAFQAIVQPFVDSICRNIHVSRSLVQLRDTLLPKLISGEIRITDAETLVGQVL